MSRARRRGEALGQIAELRRISTHIAEQQALQAQRALREAERERADEEERLTEILDHWDCARSAIRFDPMTLAAWSVEIDQQVKTVARSETAVTERRSERDTAQATLGLASAAERCADMLLRRTRQRLARQRDEGRLAELDDASTRKVLIR